MNTIFSVLIGIVSSLLATLILKVASYIISRNSNKKPKTQREISIRFFASLICMGIFLLMCVGPEANVVLSFILVIAAAICFSLCIDSFLTMEDRLDACNNQAANNNANGNPNNRVDIHVRVSSLK